jgi:hypothetical protein
MMDGCPTIIHSINTVAMQTLHGVMQELKHQLEE